MGNFPNRFNTRYSRDIAGCFAMGWELSPGACGGSRTEDRFGTTRGRNLRGEYGRSNSGDVAFWHLPDSANRHLTRSGSFDSTLGSERRAGIGERIMAKAN